jgi:hypothetical protein
MCDKCAHAETALVKLAQAAVAGALSRSRVTQAGVLRARREISRSAVYGSNVQSEEARNDNYYDHDADDIEDVHCVLRWDRVTSYEDTAPEEETPRRQSKFHS